MSSKERGGLSKKEWEKEHGTKWVSSSFKYDKKDQKKDRKKAEEQLSPYYETQISDTLEDLNATMETVTANYKRTMRSNRATMARAGTAMGKFRDRVDEDTTSAHEKYVENLTRGAERQVGSEQIKKAGYKSQYTDRVGSINEAFKAGVEERVNQYEQERTNEFYAELGINYGSTA